MSSGSLGQRGPLLDVRQFEDVLRLAAGGGKVQQRQALAREGLAEIRGCPDTAGRGLRRRQTHLRLHLGMGLHDDLTACDRQVLRPHGVERPHDADPQLPGEPFVLVHQLRAGADAADAAGAGIRPNIPCRRHDLPQRQIVLTEQEVVDLLRADDQLEALDRLVLAVVQEKVVVGFRAPERRPATTRLHRIVGQDVDAELARKIHQHQMQGLRRAVAGADRSADLGPVAAGLHQIQHDVIRWG